MNLREFLRSILPQPPTVEGLIDSRELQMEIERRQRDIERRLQLLGIEVDLTRDDYRRRRER